VRVGSMRREFDFGKITKFPKLTEFRGLFSQTPNFVIWKIW
jgi:hypothetical protein